MTWADTTMSTAFTWNTAGIMSQSAGQADVRTVITHELARRKVYLSAALLIAVSGAGVWQGVLGTRDRTQRPLQTIRVSGFPLDRSFGAMVADARVNLVVRMDRLQAGVAHWTTADGSAPAYITESRAPTRAEAEANDKIATPIEGRIVKLLFGRPPGQVLSTEVLGGRVGSVQVVGGDEQAPDVLQLTAPGSRILAGTLQPSGFVELLYVYAEASGQVRSLLSSGNGPEPETVVGPYEEQLARLPAR